MSTLNSLSTICLPAHILDAPITPRAREVLMLLASQTSIESPTLWICQARIAERLRCSTATVARAIQKLLEEKLIAETGQLHQGRYKFYHVRWSREETIKAASKKITKAIRKVVATTEPVRAPMPFEGVQLILPPVAETVRGFSEEQSRKNPPDPLFLRGSFEQSLAPPPSAPPPSTMPSTITPQAILKDSRLAYYAEIARKRHQESRQLHQSILLSLR